MYVKKNCVSALKSFVQNFYLQICVTALICALHYDDVVFSKYFANELYVYVFDL